MAKTIKQLKRQIMRRVYYAYAIQTITNPAYTYGFLMGLCVVLLTQFVSFPNLINNLLSIEVGRVPMWAYNAFTTTEASTLVLTGVIIFAALSLRFKLHLPKRETLKPQRA